MKTILPVAVLLPFTVFSTLVIAQHGYTGFLTLSAREPWALQMLLDLSVALFIVGAWIRKDARARGIAYVPYLLLLPVLGSIGALLYLVRRSLVRRPELAVSGPR